MCGILVYKYQGNNFFIQKRGQDFTNKVERNDFYDMESRLKADGRGIIKNWVYENNIV